MIESRLADQVASILAKRLSATPTGCPFCDPMCASTIADAVASRLGWPLPAANQSRVTASAISNAVASRLTSLANARPEVTPLVGEVASAVTRVLEEAQSTGKAPLSPNQIEEVATTVATAVITALAKFEVEADISNKPIQKHQETLGKADAKKK